MDNSLNPSSLFFSVRPRSSHFLSLILQICPPTREYPRVFTGATDTGVPCHFPEALKHIEAKCHGQVGLTFLTILPAVPRRSISLVLPSSSVLWSMSCNVFSLK